MQIESISKKNKWCFSTGTIGRDMAYTLISMFLFTYVQYTAEINEKQLWAITMILVVCRIWDAVNDPIMSKIITNFKSKYGKYRPWILIGGLTNALVLVMFFSIRPSGWGFVLFFGILYLLWDMTFTMNDVGYWSLLPALSSNKKVRDQLTTMVAVCASIGAFAVGGLVPVLTPGNMIAMYRIIAIIIAIIFAGCQIMVFFCVKEESRDDEEEQEKVSFKGMIKIIFENKQLLVMAVVVLLYSLGSAILNALGVNYFYFEFGYGGNSFFLFTVIYALGTILSQGLYSKLASKFKRSDLVKYSMVALVVGYLAFFVIGSVPLNDSAKLIVLCIFGILIFAGQGVFYLSMLVMLMNTIEYGEYKTGIRHESINFTIRPFMVKLASAIQQLIVMATLSMTGLVTITSQISELENARDHGLITAENTVMQANALINGANNAQIIGLLFAMTIVPILMFLGMAWLIKKKYVIDEELYEKMVTEIDQKKLAK